MENKIEKVTVTYKDRLSRSELGLINYIFKKYRTEIIVISEVGNRVS